jgi:hypothetical protein
VHENVHVAVQVRRDPEGLVAGDAPSAEWRVDITVADDKGALDFKGPAVHGKKGERFLYLTWGDVDAAGAFHMFRRAKLMLNRVDRRSYGPRNGSSPPSISPTTAVDPAVRASTRPRSSGRLTTNKRPRCWTPTPRSERSCRRC